MKRKSKCCYCKKVITTNCTMHHETGKKLCPECIAGAVAVSIRAVVLDSHFHPVKKDKETPMNTEQKKAVTEWLGE